MSSTADTPNLGDGPAESAAEMEIAEQVSTYRAFNGLVKWGSLAVATGVLFLVLLFCVHAGFFPAAFICLVLLVVGFVGLRKKVAADPVHAPS